MEHTVVNVVNIWYSGKYIYGMEKKTPVMKKPQHRHFHRPGLDPHTEIVMESDQRTFWFSSSLSLKGEFL